MDNVKPYIQLAAGFTLLVSTVIYISFLTYNQSGSSGAKLAFKLENECSKLKRTNGEFSHEYIQCNNRLQKIIKRLIKTGEINLNACRVTKAPGKLQNNRNKTPVKNDNESVQTGKIAKADNVKNNANLDKKIDTPNMDAKVENPKKIATSDSDAKIEIPQKIDTSNMDAKIENPKKIDATNMDAKIQNPKYIETTNIAKTDSTGVCKVWIWVMFRKVTVNDPRLINSIIAGKYIEVENDTRTTALQSRLQRNEKESSSSSSSSESSSPKHEKKIKRPRKNRESSSSSSSSESGHGKRRKKADVNKIEITIKGDKPMRIK